MLSSDSRMKVTGFLDDPNRNLRLLAAGILWLSTLVAPAPLHAQGCSADINGDGRVDASDLSTVLVNWGTCSATISSVSPAQGSVLGGTVITLTGTGLAATSVVTVGGASCSNLTVLSPTQVRVTTPPGSAGQAAIAVTTPAGTSVATVPFTYVLQAVTAIVPAGGPYQGGTAITISGQNLGGTTSVTIGGVPATNVVAVSATTVTAVTPPGLVGAFDVVVTGTKGAVTVPGGFTYQSFIVPSWATLVEAMPDPAVVWDPGLRQAIVATGYAWRVRDSATQIEMLLVPPAVFDMGCSASIMESCSMNENPVHAVTLTNPFYLGRYEVTQAQWSTVMGSNPSHFRTASAEVPAAQVPNRPVERVSWNTIQGFLAVTGMRLPTEAEWERACRAGSTTAFHGFQGYSGGFLNGTNDDTQAFAIGWHQFNSNLQTRPVGGRSRNGLGLNDMAGNVWEFVSDWYSSSYYASSSPVDPLGPDWATDRVMRGGGWEWGPNGLRSSFRGSSPPTLESAAWGFRVARNPR